ARTIAETRTRLAAQPGDKTARQELCYALLDSGWTTLALNEASVLVQQGQSDAQFLMAIVRALEHQGKHDHLTLWLERLLAADYRNAHALERLSRIAIDREDLWRANSLISTYLMHYPDDGMMLERGGHLSIRLGKHDEGKRWLEKAWSSGRKTHTIAETLGHIALNHSKDQAGAEAWFERARQLQPDTSSATLSIRRRRLENQRLQHFADFYGQDAQRQATILLRMAENSLETGEYRTALDLASRVTETQPNQADGFIIKARAQMALTRFERSRTSLKRALQLEPANPRAWWYLAELHATQALPDPDARLEALRQAVRLAPGEPVYTEAMAAFWLSRNNLDEARNWYRKATSLNQSSTNLETLRSLERRLIERDLKADESSSQGNRDALIETGRRYFALLGPAHPGYHRCLEAASLLDPEHAGLHVLTADAAIKLFLSDMQYPLLQAARAHLETALRIEPENTDALAVKAALRSWELEQPGDMPTVTEKLTSLDLLTDPQHYQDLLEAARSPDAVRAARWYMTGKILYNKNRDPAAAQYLSRALAIPSPDSAGIARALGGILRNQGDLDGAIKAYERLLAVPNLAGYHEYAIASLVIGNLHAEKARSFPRTLKDLLETWPACTNLQACLQTAPELSRFINDSINRARLAYQGYIQRSAFDTHKSRGQTMITLLSDIPSDQTAAIRRMALVQAQAGQTLLARQILHQTITNTRAGLQPSALRILMGDLADLLSREGLVNEANAVWADIMARFPNDWRSHHGHARYLFSLGEREQTIKAFERAIRLSPRDNDMRTALGFLYWKNRQPDLAVKALEESLALDEDNLHALYYMSRIELERGNLERAVTNGEHLVNRFKQAMGQNYADPRVRDMLLDTLATLARASFRAGSISKSLEYVWEGIDLDRENQFGFLALAGDIRILQNKHEEAEQFYARAVRSDPGNDLYRFKWAQAMAGCGKEEQAIRLLDELWKKSARFIRQQDVHLVYARILTQHNRRDDARLVLEDLVGNMPWLEAGYIALSRHLADDGKNTESRSILEKGLDHIKNAPDIQDALAWNLARLGGPALVRARNLAVENVRRHPQSVEYRATLGYILHGLGYPESAGRSAESALLDDAARKRQPAAETGTSIAAAERHFAARRWAQALDLIAAGEGSRELASSEKSVQAVFHLLLTKSTPQQELSPY
ncbi:MAG TPA: tetratricopeptide repeat protein, partial [Spirochaetota bacterium]|nr:tetratricopeptide repeat protein [Spirochaetota bacterium]